MLQSLSNVLGHMRIFTKILKYYILPYPPFNVELSVPQIMMAVDIQTSNSTLNWGGGGGRECHFSQKFITNLKRFYKERGGLQFLMYYKRFQVSHLPGWKMQSTKRRTKVSLKGTLFRPGSQSYSLPLYIFNVRTEISVTL